jgi:hypothetical protein
LNLENEGNTNALNTTRKLEVPTIENTNPYFNFKVLTKKLQI